MGLFGGGLLGDLTGSTAAGTPKSSTFQQQGAGNLISLLFQAPALLQGLQLMAFLGKDIGEFLITGKKAVKDASKKGGSDFLKIDKSTGIDAFALAQAIPALAAEAETKKLQLGQDTFDKFAKTPQFENIFKEAAGDFAPTFTAAIDNAFTQIGGAALGKAAGSGFLASEQKQAAVLGPLALQKTQFLKQLQKSSEAQAIGLAGGSPFAVNSQTGISSAQQLIPSTLNVAALDQANNQFNSQLGFEQAAFQSAQTSSFIGSLLGGGGFGGGTGGFSGGTQQAGGAGSLSAFF